MDAYEATKIVYQRIQNLDPENASKIMGMLLIQDHGEKEMIRLAFGPESTIHSVILKSKKELFSAQSNAPSTPSTPSSPCPFAINPLSLSRQNSCSYRLNLPSPLSITNHSSPWTKNTTNFSDDVITTNGSSPSTMNSAADPFYGNGTEVHLIDELQLQDQLSFLNDGSPRAKSSDLFCENDVGIFPYAAANWGGADHRRSCSVSDVCMVSDDVSGGFGWKPCLYYARGYCKNGTSCRFLHGEGGGAPTAADGGAMSPSKFEMMEQELLRSKSTQQQRLAAASHLMSSTNFPNYSNSCMNFLMQQHLPAVQSPRFSKARLERGDFGINCLIPGSRQIYLTFPADSTFKEEDVSNYFSIFGPVQDVRIPYQQKRMFGFVTFDYPETVKLILAKGNPHFVCEARVLVKPYKERGKIPEKHRRQGQMERGEFPGCGSPTGLESRDPFDLQLGARMFYNTQDMLWRRKLEEQADLQQAIELQNRRIMNLQILDVKRNSHHRALSTGAVVSSPTYSPTYFNRNLALFSGHNSPEAKEENGSMGTVANLANNVSEEEAIGKDGDSFVKDDDNVNGKTSPTKENDFQESFEHNLPESPFASPKASVDYFTPVSNDNFEVENGNAVSQANNNLINGSSLFPATPPSLDMAPFKSCHFQVPRFSSGHETIGM